MDSEQEMSGSFQDMDDDDEEYEMEDHHGMDDRDMMEGEDDEDNLDFENDPSFAHLPPLDRNRWSRRDILQSINEIRI